MEAVPSLVRSSPKFLVGSDAGCFGMTYLNVTPTTVLLCSAQWCHRYLLTHTVKTQVLLQFSSFRSRRLILTLGVAISF